MFIICILTIFIIVLLKKITFLRSCGFSLELDGHIYIIIYMA